MASRGQMNNKRRHEIELSIARSKAAPNRKSMRRTRLREWRDMAYDLHAELQRTERLRAEAALGLVEWAKAPDDEQRWFCLDQTLRLLAAGDYEEVVRMIKKDGFVWEEGSDPDLESSSESTPETTAEESPSGSTVDFPPAPQ